MAGKEREWFNNWFDTIYYHILYKKRDDIEAARFIDATISLLAPPKGSRFLDLACGKGRHSIYLNQKGFKVTGIDLSVNNIKYAQKSASPSLQFLEHDMRLPFEENAFDYVLNLFTSFGYFNDAKDDLAVITNVKRCLKPGGIFVLDYFNASKPNPNFDVPFTKEIDKIRFDIKKHIDKGRIIKEICVTDKGKVCGFAEQVRIYTLEQFKQIMAEQGFKLLFTFGSYSLEPYDPLNSDRLILIAKN